MWMCRSQSGPVIQSAERVIDWPDSSQNSVSNAGYSSNLPSDYVQFTEFPDPRSSFDPEAPRYLSDGRDINPTYYASTQGVRRWFHRPEKPPPYESRDRGEGTVASVYASLPMRHNFAHFPVGVAAPERSVASGHLHSQSVMRRSYRESGAVDPGGFCSGGFQRFVSLQPHQRRSRRPDVLQNRYEVAMARSAQVWQRCYLFTCVTDEMCAYQKTGLVSNRK